jgi:DNA-binding XRE family transcriptional regulator
VATHYRRFSGQALCPAPLPTVPHDYDRRLRALRRRLRLTQGGLAQRIGAAGKAVIYQWESRKRTPSPESAAAPITLLMNWTPEAKK